MNFTSFKSCVRFLLVFWGFILFNVFYFPQDGAFKPHRVDHTDAIQLQNPDVAFAMTCGAKPASFAPSSYKPSIQTDGAEFVLSQLNSQNKSYNFVFGIFKGDHREKQQCEDWKKAYNNVQVYCFNIDIPFPDGYGMSKVYFISKVPIKNIIWLDCDAFFIGGFESVLDSFLRQGVSAFFWQDLENHYKRQNVIFEKYGVRYDESNQKHVIGFDSGLMFINKEKSKKAIEFLINEICRNIEKWKSLSMGDKDLWHLAWDLTETPYVYIPWVGGIGSKTDENLQIMAGQTKFDEGGNPLVMHQMWKSGNSILKHDLVFRKDIRDGAQVYPYKAEGYEIEHTPKKIQKVILKAGEAWKHLNL